MNAIITQSDMVTAYGWGEDALWNGLMSGQTAIKPTTRFAERGFISNQAALVQELEAPAGESRAMTMLSRLLKPLVGNIDPLTPIILATTVGEVEYVERAVFESDPSLLEESRPPALLRRIKTLLELTGPGIALSSACASSATAVAHAAGMIRHGDARRVLVVAVDAVTEFVYSGFSTLMSLCEGPARPFDADRSGLTLGEAAVYAMIEARDEGSPGDVVAIKGWGNTTDAVHMTAPDRNAGGLHRAVSKACAMAGRHAHEIDFIAAHGTATAYSDAMEMIAFRRLIGEPRALFSIKGGVGHALGAAGLLQILVAARSLRMGTVPPTVGLETPDPAALGWATHSAVSLPSPTLALSTNSGFGGVNTAVLLSRQGDA